MGVFTALLGLQHACTITRDSFYIYQLTYIFVAFALCRKIAMMYKIAACLFESGILVLIISWQTTL